MLEVTAIGVDKVFGLKAVAEFYEISLSQILAFDDGVNGATMLKAVGFGVAMNHAAPVTQKAADMVACKTAAGVNLAAAIEGVLTLLARR